jgi:nucleoside-diphosphate-sugar epimerase
LAVPSAADEAPSAIVTGGTGLVGRHLVPMLVERGFTVQAVSRRSRPGPAGGGPSGGVHWVAMDLEDPRDVPGRRAGAMRPAACLFHLAPIWLLPSWLSVAAEAGVLRLVALSSTSRFTKRRSSSARERETARRLAEAEEAVESGCRERGIRWTVLRPTLVYGGADRNVSEIARFVRRFGFFPIAGEGVGRRQPVHAGDLARACLAVLDRSATFDRAYDTPGGETLAYGEMVSRIARGVGRKPRLLRLPLPLLRGALGLASRLPGLRHLTPDVADRMEVDLVFDGSHARRDFGYDPRPFRFPGEPGLRSADPGRGES